MIILCRTFFLSFFLLGCNASEPSDEVKENLTILRLRVTEAAFQDYFYVYGATPIVNSEVISVLSGNNPKGIKFISQPYLSDESTLLDGWGNSIVIQPAGVPNQIQLWSFGANGVSDNTQGDDIAKLVIADAIDPELERSFPKEWLEEASE